MFQKKDIEAYRETQAPVELKNRIQSSIEQQRRRIRKQQMSFLAAAAGFVLILSVGGLFDQNSIIVSVNDTAVSKEGVELYSSVRSGPAMATQAPIQVPMEIQVKENAQVQVSQGTLQSLEADGTSKEGTELEICEQTVIYWTVEGNTTDIPTCTIITDDETYVYIIVYDDTQSVFMIKQEK